MNLSRRRLLLAGAGVWTLGGIAFAAPSPSGRVYKSASCGCCGGWVEHMQGAGFRLDVIVVPEVTPYRQRLSVPETLASCHTAEIGGYAIEGHVPAADVLRLLRERPAARGLSVPAMVPGSPGMSGKPVPYETLIFEASGKYRTFARH